jgi:glycosyltransferase involved in cell wall biosynthesis
MKILHIIGSGHLGGAETFLHQFILQYQRTKPQHRSAILYAEKKGPLCNIQEIKQYDGAAYRSFSSNKALFKLFRQYDLIVFHGLYPKFMLIAFCIDRPILYFMHGVRSLRKSIRTISAKMLRASYRPNKNGFVRVFRLLCFRYFLKIRCKMVLVPSNYYKSIAQTKYGIKPQKIKILPLGIDITRFSKYILPKDRPATTGRINIGCVASFRRIKRIDRLIRAVGYMQKSDRKKIRIILVGAGECEQSLKHLARELYIDKQITFIQPEENISKHYSKMNLFVLPSESESFSLVLLEAMYFSIPNIVFSGSGGAEELIDKTGCGMVVDNEKQLAGLLSQLIKNPDLLSTLSVKSRQIVENNYTISAAVKNFLRLVESE